MEFEPIRVVQGGAEAAWLHTLASFDAVVVSPPEEIVVDGLVPDSFVDSRCHQLFV